MMSFIVTRGFANKSKPLMRRKYRKGSGGWGVSHRERFSCRKQTVAFGHESGYDTSKNMGTLLTFGELHRDESVARRLPNPMTSFFAYQSHYVAFLDQGKTCLWAQGHRFE